MTRHTDRESRYLDETGHPGGALLATAVIAAMAGAGIALLYAPAKGEKTRKKVGRKVKGKMKGGMKGLKGAASAGAERLRHEVLERRDREQKRREAQRRYAIIGAAIGAGVLLMVSPGGERVRSRLGDRWNDLRHGGDGTHDADEPKRTVRTVQELDRDPTQIF